MDKRVTLVIQNRQGLAIGVWMRPPTYNQANEFKHKYV